MIDTTFNVYSDSRGRDPDTHSPTLRKFHCELWSKKLPNGTVFNLTTNQIGHYLHHESMLGEFSLSSDSLAHTYRYVKSTAKIISKVPEEDLESFYALACTVGGYIIFPAKKIDGKATINGTRGLNPKIRDRFDLTLECVKRHYHGERSPLSDVFNRYTSFFQLFGSFEGYVDFFLLQDMVTDSGTISFALPFDGFDRNPIPQDLSEYMTYRAAMVTFISGRNERILVESGKI